jgi:hypothetical protein
MKQNHLFFQDNWWVIVQYPKNIEIHPKCSCGLTLKVKSKKVQDGSTIFTLHCEAKNETNRKMSTVR